MAARSTKRAGPGPARLQKNVRQSSGPVSNRRPLRVKLRRTQCEQMSSGLLKADIARPSPHVSKVPNSDIPRSILPLSNDHAVYGPGECSRGRILAKFLPDPCWIIESVSLHNLCNLIFHGIQVERRPLQFRHPNLFPSLACRSMMRGKPALSAGDVI